MTRAPGPVRPNGPGGGPTGPPIGGPSRDPGTIGSPDEPDATDDDKRERRWSLAERMLAILAAVLGVVAGCLGIWGSQATAERDDLETTADSLVEERDDLRENRNELSDDLDAAQAKIDELEDAASATTTTSTPDDSVPDDPVSPGTPLPGEPVYLNQLDPVAGNAKVDETEIGGTRYRNVVRLETYECGSTPDAVAYNLGAGYERFTALAGLHDTVLDPRDIWRFVVTTIDATGEHIVFEQELHFAQPVQVDVSVAGAQRLRLSIESVDVDGEARCPSDDYPATWADPKLT